MWRSDLWSISWLPPRYAKVTIYAMWGRHFLFLSSFSGTQRILGYVRPRRIEVVHPPKTGRRRSIWRSLQIGTAVAWRCDVIGLQMLFWRMQTLNWDTATVCHVTLLSYLRIWHFRCVDIWVSVWHLMCFGGFTHTITRWALWWTHCRLPLWVFFYTSVFLRFW